MLTRLTFYFCLSFSFITLYASELDLENATAGRNITPLSSQEFYIENSNPELIKTKLLKQSFRWVRYNNIILLPVVRIKIIVSLSHSDGLELVYKQNAYSFQQNAKNASIEIEYSLFEKSEIQIFKNNKKNSQITIKRKPAGNNHISIDYNCSRNNVKIQGLKSEAISIGCKIVKTGNLGSEEPILELNWLSPDLKLQNKKVIQKAIFTRNGSHRIRVLNTHSGAQKEITLSATIPKRSHRLFTAAGIGMNALDTSILNEEGTKSIHEPLAPAFFLYANYQLNETQSIRGFNAAVFKESIFDNAGVYLGSDFGFTFDNRLYFTTLIGMQYLYFKFNKDSDVISEPIFPQGIEFMYRHAFDIPNYIVSGGFFISLENELDYQNAWIRWGKKYFWEINFIGWKRNDFSASMWGLSLGFPLKGFL